GIFFQPLFLRDGQDLKFTEDMAFALSNPRLSVYPAVQQKQPYGDLLFRETDRSLKARRSEAEQSLNELDKTISEAKAKGVETAYAEIYPFLAQIAFHSRLVAFWQNRSEEQRSALNFLIEGSRKSTAELRAAMQ